MGCRDVNRLTIRELELRESPNVDWNTKNLRNIRDRRIRPHIKSSARILLLSLPVSSTFTCGGSGGGSTVIF